jgi:hypothetical protein
MDRKVKGSKATERDHLEQVAKQLGKSVEELESVENTEEPPTFPDVALHIWAAFLELHNGRTYNMSGPNPISYDTIYFWCRMMGIELTPWEIGVIKDLDNIYIRAMGEENV